MSNILTTLDLDMFKHKFIEKTIIIRCILFLVIFAALFAYLNFLFHPVTSRENNYHAEGYFYNEPDNTIETIILGASISYHGITPMELYENYGICAYALGSPHQPVLSSYYWLEEAYRLHGETLKTVVFDVSSMRHEVDESWYRLNIDAMNFSSVKWRAILDYTDSFEESLSCLIPFFSYHDRWVELSKGDFTKSEYDKRDYLRGYHIKMLSPRRYFTNNSYTSLSVPDYYPDYDADEMELMTESLYCLKQMITFCKEHDIRLVLIKTPGQSIGVSGHNAVQTIADKYGLDFLDFNYAPLIDEIGYNHAIDSYDGSHMNYYGAKKLTAWLGNYLVEECGATDVRGVEGYEFMEDELKQYHSNVTEVMDLKNVTDPAEYLSIVIPNANYTVFVAVKDEASKALTEEQREGFDSLGLIALSGLGIRDSYLAVIDGGAVICEQTETNPEIIEEEAEEDVRRNDIERITMEDVRRSREKEETEELTISYEGMLPDGTVYVLTSGGYMLGNKASLMLNNMEYASNTRGLNIVVYDKVKKEVVDSAVFDTNLSSIREGSDLETALAEALEHTDDYTMLSSNLRKLYLYNQRCEDKRNLSYLRLLAGEDGLLTYLDGVLSNEDYAVFLSVKDEASKSLSSEARKAFYERGFVELSKLELRDSYLAVILGGTLVYELRDHGEEAISVSDEWVMDTLNRINVQYSVISGGYESGNLSSICIGGTEYSADSRGINIVVWNTVTNKCVASVTFDTYAIPVRLADGTEQTD